MMTLTHNTGTRVPAASRLRSERLMPGTTIRPATAWSAITSDVVNQYPIHAFAKKHHSQRAKPT